MSKEIIGIAYTMKLKKNGYYILIDNETGNELCAGTEKQIRELFNEQNEREYNRLAKRTLIESQNKFKADAIIDGGEEMFRTIALGKCYSAVLKMIDNQQVTEEQGSEFMNALELYAFNENTPLSAETGRKYYQKYKNSKAY